METDLPEYMKTEVLREQCPQWTDEDIKRRQYIHRNFAIVYNPMAGNDEDEIAVYSKHTGLKIPFD